MRLFITIAGVLMVALALSGVTAAAGPPTDRGPATHIVVFNDGVDADAASQDLAQAHGLVREFVYSQALNGASFIVPPGRVAAIESDPRVAFIERNQIVKAFAQELPTGVDRIDAALSSTANIDGADDRVDVDIAIIDTGIDLDHPDLNVVASINCARGGPFGGGCKGGGDDGNGHGTHVAGTAAALDNGIGVVGVAPGARLWAVRVLDNSGSGWMSWIVGGIDWVTANADQIDVANMSLGCACDSAALDAAIAGSVAAGVVYTVAAGNSGSDAAGYSPANHPDVITVSAIADFDGQGGALAATTCRSDAGSDDTFATFSNDGSLIEIAAPGVCILSTWNDGGYNTISGTSMASPHAAGAAALYIAASGTVADGAGAAAVRDALIAAGTPQGDADGFTGDTDGHAEPLLNVGDTEAGPQAPKANAGADVTVSDGDGSGAETVSLDGSGSSDADGTIVSYEWDLDGDGRTDVTGTSPVVTFTFALGAHTVTLTVTDNAGAASSDSVVITVTEPSAAPTSVSVGSIIYTTTGGRNRDKHLEITLALVDNQGNPASNASVTIDLFRDGSFVASGTGTTGEAGTLTFTLNNAASGCYETTVTDVSAGTLTWDGATPANGLCK